jgi:hypothetical protein
VADPFASLGDGRASAFRKATTAVPSQLRVPLGAFCDAARTDSGNLLDLSQVYELALEMTTPRAGVAIDNVELVIDGTRPPSTRGCLADFVARFDRQDQGFTPRFVPPAFGADVDALSIHVEPANLILPELEFRTRRLDFESGQAVSFYLYAKNFGAYPGVVTADIYCVEENAEGMLEWLEIAREAVFPDYRTNLEAEIAAGGQQFLGPALRRLEDGVEVIEIGLGPGSPDDPPFEGLIVFVLHEKTLLPAATLERGPVFSDPTSLTTWDQLRIALSLDNNYAAAFFTAH